MHRHECRFWPQIPAKLAAAPAAGLRLQLSAESVPQPKERIEEKGEIYTRSTITSVDLINAATVSPTSSCISRVASAVMMELMIWPPIDSLI